MRLLEPESVIWTFTSKSSHDHHTSEDAEQAGLRRQRPVAVIIAERSRVSGPMLRVVMLRVSSAVVCCLLLAAAPVRAQNSDVFREDAPPAPAAPDHDPFQMAPADPAPAPKPPSRPHPAPEPEAVAPAPPPVAPQPAVAPAPAMPPADQLWARIRQVAQAVGIRMPLASSPPFDEAGTPSQYRALLGAWGPGTWQGNSNGEKAILIVEGVDGSGNMHAVAGKSDGGSLPAAWAMSLGSVASGGRFLLKIGWRFSEYQHGTNQLEQVWQMELRPDGTLAGSRDNGASTIVLRRLQ